MSIPYRVAVLICGMAVAAASCDKKSRETRESPTSPSGAEFVSLRLTAPERVSPGESVQLRAEAVRSNGSAEDVSTTATWSSSNPLVLQVTASGLATAGARGESNVQVRHSGRIAQSFILALPPDTFRLGGFIKESGIGVSGVSVRILEGVGQGLRTFSDPGGEYSLFGASGTVRVQLTKAGYSDSVQEVDVTAHRRQDFHLVPERPRADYGGTYTLRLTAEPGCHEFPPNSFPGAAKRREYTANVTQDGPRVTVVLSDAGFIVTSGRGNSFVGTLDILNTMTFTISAPNFDWYGPWYYGYPEVAETFSGGTLIISGVVSMQGTPSLLSGTLNGYILTSGRTSFPFGPPYSSVCTGQHGFEMVRR